MTAGSLQFAAIIISCISLAVALFSLGWNIYRDVVLKARVRISFSLRRYLVGQEKLDQLAVVAVNLGPGSIRLTSIVLRHAPYGVDFSGEHSGPESCRTSTIHFQAGS